MPGRLLCSGSAGTRKALSSSSESVVRVHSIQWRLRAGASAGSEGGLRVIEEAVLENSPRDEAKQPASQLLAADPEGVQALQIVRPHAIDELYREHALGTEFRKDSCTDDLGIVPMQALLGTRSRT